MNWSNPLEKEEKKEKQETWWWIFRIFVFIAVFNSPIIVVYCVGYLGTSGVEPADYILFVETEQAEAVVGAQINLRINSNTR